MTYNWPWKNASKIRLYFKLKAYYVPSTVLDAWRMLMNSKTSLNKFLIIKKGHYIKFQQQPLENQWVLKFFNTLKHCLKKFYTEVVRS